MPYGLANAAAITAFTAFTADCAGTMMRLRLPVSDQDMPCPLCDGVLDRHAHARVCSCGGDCMKRHHRLRSIVAARAHAAGLHPEIEKAGLIPPRPDDSGGPEDGARQAGGGRRPADVWVGSWGLHGAAAFDLAVSSGLRQGSVAASATAGEQAAADYEAKKCAFLNTCIHFLMHPSLHTDSMVGKVSQVELYFVKVHWLGHWLVNSSQFPCLRKSELYALQMVAQESVAFSNFCHRVYIRIGEMRERDVAQILLV